MKQSGAPNTVLGVAGEKIKKVETSFPEHSSLSSL